MTAAVSLAMATLAFVGTHLLLSHPLRAPLVARLGEGAFLGVYSLIALVTFGWLIFAWFAVDPNPSWVAPLWWWPFASAIMAAASVLLVGSLIGNPALPHPGAPPRAIPPPRGVFAITRHPMNWSFMIWAAVHVSIAGDARNLIVASGIFILALFGSIGQDRKKARLIGEPWRQWQARTSFVPFGALLDRKSRWRDAWPGWIALLGGLALWGAATSYHVPLVSPLGDLLSR
jgi:uncharacterized membrane protein